MKQKKLILLLVLSLMILFVGCNTITPTNTKATYELDKTQLPTEIAVDKFDISCLKINITYASGLKATIDVTESMLSEDDLKKIETAGTHLINIKYNDLEETVQIVLKDASLTPETTYSLDISNLKQEYKINEFDLSNIVIVATHEQGDKEYIKVSKEMLTNDDQEKITKEGTHTLTIKYNDFVKEVTIKLVKDDAFIVPTNTISIIDIEGLDIKQNETTTIKYRTTGIIQSILDSNVGKLTIKDDSGLLTINSLKDINGKEFNLFEEKPEKGDTITIEGNVKNEDGANVFVNVVLIQLTKNELKQDYIDANNYYKDAVGLEGTELKLKLRQIISANYKSVTYESLNNYLALTDASPFDSNKILLFYTRKEISNKWDSGKTWNKEHVWPRSTGWFQYDKAGSDAHHIRAVDSGENSRRGNKPYGSGSGSYLPSDNVKGDVARILFYLLVRYQESDSYKINVVATSMNMLLEWNQLDPVDDIERKRNEEVFKIQNNRNPFIDNSDYAYYIWDTSFLTKTANNTSNFEVIGIVQVYCIIDNKKGRKGLFYF